MKKIIKQKILRYQKTIDSFLLKLYPECAKGKYLDSISELYNIDRLSSVDWQRGYGFNPEFSEEGKLLSIYLQLDDSFREYAMNYIHGIASKYTYETTHDYKVSIGGHEYIPFTVKKDIHYDVNFPSTDAEKTIHWFLTGKKLEIYPQHFNCRCSIKNPNDSTQELMSRIHEACSGMKMDRILFDRLTGVLDKAFDDGLLVVKPDYNLNDAALKVQISSDTKEMNISMSIPERKK